MNKVVLSLACIFIFVSGCNDVDSRKKRFIKSNDLYVSKEMNVFHVNPYLTNPYLKKKELAGLEGVRYFFELNEIGRCIYYLDAKNEVIFNWGVSEGEEFCLDPKINYGAQ